jgi:tetratricopeptide (TPR) repeat protein
MMLLHRLIPAALATLAVALPAAAQMLQEPALEALYQAERNDELQRTARQRLAAQPDDAQAVLALALVALQGGSPPALRREALERAEGCATRLPTATPCRYAHGVLLGVQAMSEGMLAAARSIGTVRDALQAAHEQQPAWYPARSALAEFHLMAPGLMGGSRAKADELGRAAPTAEQRQALQARALLADKQHEAALAAFMGLPSTLEPTLADDVRAWGVQAGMAMVNAGGSAKALPFFERVVRDRPGHAAGHYALARAKGELGDWPEALRLLELAATLKGAQDWPMAYRIGIAQQQLGRNDAARASFKRFVDAGKGQKASLEDARKRLKELGG